MKKIIIIALMSIISINVFGQQHLPDTIIVGDIKLIRNEFKPTLNPEYVRYISHISFNVRDFKYLESNGFYGKMKKQLKKMGYIVNGVELKTTIHFYAHTENWLDDYTFSGVEVILVDEAVRKEHRELTRKSEVARKNRLDNILESIR